MFWSVVLIYWHLYNSEPSLNAPPFRPIIIVICPLLELMEDQVKRFNKLMIAAGYPQFKATHISSRQTDKKVFKDLEF